MNTARGAIYICRKLKILHEELQSLADELGGPRQKFQCELRRPTQSYRSKASCIQSRLQRPGLVGIFNRFPRQSTAYCDK